MAPFTAKQLEVIRYDNRVRPKLTICEGSVRSGKTRAILPLWIAHVGEFAGQRKRFIITGHTLGAIKRNILDELSDIFGIDTKINQNSEFWMFGNIIVCAGAETETDYKKITGFTAYGWLANEATLQNMNTIRQGFARCSGKGARIFWDTNPDSPINPIKTEYIDKSGEIDSQGKVRLKSWHFDLEDNTFLPPDYVENLKSSTPSGVWYDRNILGLWVAAEGMIYKDWKPSFIVDKAPEIKRYFTGVDWGYREGHSGVYLTIGENETGYYIMEEIAAIEKEIDWWKEKATYLRGKYGNGMPFYCDTARPEYIKAIGGQDAIKDVLPGIETVAGLMKKKQLFIVRGMAPLWEKEVYSYHWAKNPGKQEPEKTMDNAMDAMRYALHTHLSKPKPSMVEARVITIEDTIRF